MIHTYLSKKTFTRSLPEVKLQRPFFSQIEIFKRGIPYTTLHRPCTVDDGITVLQQSTIEALEILAQAVSAGRVTKFVPASGAATRMFQALISYYEHKRLRTAKIIRCVAIYQQCKTFCLLR